MAKKGLRSLPSGWIQNPDGSFSKPKGQEVLLSGFTDPKKIQSAEPMTAEMLGLRPRILVEKKIATEQSEVLNLNKTERSRLRHLEMLKMPYIGVQEITLKLAFDCRFTADFTYFDENGRLTFEDVKGFQREDALIKIKVAARKFPYFRFVIVKRTSSGWEMIDVKP